MNECVLTEREKVAYLCLGRNIASARLDDMNEIFGQLQPTFKKSAYRSI